VSDYRKLAVWQKSRELVVSVYQATGNFPSGEVFGLTSQIRRAATSIPANIAEGPVGGVILISSVFSGSRWVQPMNSKPIWSLPAISDF
jgi:hypothetical protein